ncbi:response regulator transcription factor [Emticicia sp. BO119]|uniref:LuxR C-terminal-related transcriptional regulator n=1 Tax=Emticicia sp. BO119 TaxID=2757768 RepID=UPI0015F0ACC1|nr:response regulator transcription factor [Emticicia sp. BO119]MBA4850554.1 response regulator transcription factor [Emticicia sp. BO119]
MKYIAALTMNKQVNILLADDYPAIINGITVELKNNRDFKVVAIAQTIDDIEKKIIQCPTDVLIISYWFRGVSSQNIIRKVRSRYPSLKIIIYTQEEKLFLVKEILPYVDGYILKTEPEGVLSKAIHRTLQHKKSISEDVRESLAMDASFNNALSKQENKILSYRLHGVSTTHISDQMSISEKTVRKHLDNARKKLGFHKTEDMMRWFWKQSQ